MNPLAGNPLRSRPDLQAAVRALVAPLEEHFSPGGARVRLGATGAHFSEAGAELDGFARPLWGLVPLAAGGGTFGGWDLYRRGLTHGTDPAHPEFWGESGDLDQRLVEMAALGFALALVPGEVWDPLTPATQSRLAEWLSLIPRVEVVDNNWLFFRVIVDLGLERVGAPHDPASREAALTRLEEFAVSGGWFTDGPAGGRETRLDYYVPFAFHFYGLIYARLAGEQDPERAGRFRARAAEFARDFAHWFADDGAALPFGRSLTYRFACGAFWGALAYAGVEALPWGTVKGLWLRHLRWWAGQPLFDRDGVLSVGYGSPNLLMSETYNSPGSPYWAMKFFLPLALPEGHPFWQAEEAPLPDLAPVSVQPGPGMVLCRVPGHVFALSGRQHAAWVRHGAAKYAKFAYSTAFTFSVPSQEGSLEGGAFDSTLAVSEDGTRWFTRERPQDFRLEGDVLFTRWSPLPGVTVGTWLLPCLPGHVRLHRLETDRALHTAEGGWALAREGLSEVSTARPEEALAVSPGGWSGLRDLTGPRKGLLVRADPNTNLLHPRTVIPTLVGRLEAGTHWLGCAVGGEPGGAVPGAAWLEVPELERMSGGFRLRWRGQEWFLPPDPSGSPENTSRPS